MHLKLTSDKGSAKKNPSSNANAILFSTMREGIPYSIYSSETNHLFSFRAASLGVMAIKRMENSSNTLNPVKNSNSERVYNCSNGKYDEIRNVSNIIIVTITSRWQEIEENDLNLFLFCWCCELHCSRLRKTQTLQFR